MTTSKKSSPKKTVSPSEVPFGTTQAMMHMADNIKALAGSMKVMIDTMKVMSKALKAINHRYSYMDEHLSDIGECVEQVRNDIYGLDRRLEDLEYQVRSPRMAVGQLS